MAAKRGREAKLGQAQEWRELFSDMSEGDSLEKRELETQYKRLPRDHIQQWNPRAEDHLPAARHRTETGLFLTVADEKRGCFPSGLWRPDCP